MYFIEAVGRCCCRAIFQCPSVHIWPGIESSIVLSGSYCRDSVRCEITAGMAASVRIMRGGGTLPSQKSRDLEAQQHSIRPVMGCLGVGPGPPGSRRGVVNVGPAAYWSSVKVVLPAFSSPGGARGMKVNKAPETLCKGAKLNPGDCGLVWRGKTFASLRGTAFGNAKDLLLSILSSHAAHSDALAETLWDALPPTHHTLTTWKPG